MRFSDFRRLASSWWATTIMQTRLSRVAEGTSTLDSVTMADEDGTSGPAEIDLTRLEQFGDVVVPVNDLDTAIIRKSDGGYSVALGQPSTRPTDGKQGDRGLYCSQQGTRIHLYGAKSAQPGAILLTQKNGARVLIDKDGQVLVDAASSKDVVVNGGTAKVSRVGDHAKLVFRATAAGPVMGFTTLTLGWLSDDGLTQNVLLQFAFAGTATVPPPGVPLDFTVLIPLVEGAEHFKA